MIKIGIAATCARAMDYGIKFAFTVSDSSSVGDVDCLDRIRFGGELLRRFRRAGPTFDLPASRKKQIRSRFCKVAATGDQDPRHRLSIFTPSRARFQFPRRDFSGRRVLAANESVPKEPEK